MYLSQSNIKLLRHQIEKEGGFQIALAPMQPATFNEVKLATDILYQQLIKQNFRVLVDDRGQRPKNIFKIIEMLDIRHQVVISGRSISAGVCEYKDLKIDEFQKINLTDCLYFLKNRVKTL